jgi:hypothetical protein
MTWLLVIMLLKWFANSPETFVGATAIAIAALMLLLSLLIHTLRIALA